MKTQSTPHVIDFDLEYTIHKIAEILRRYDISVCESLLEELDIELPKYCKPIP